MDNSGGYCAPGVGDFKAYFVRDFPYAADDQGLEFVQDSDIQKALMKTGWMLNQTLASCQDMYTFLYLTLSAHNMVIDLRNAAQGVASQGDWLTVGKAAGPVSQSFQIPQRILDNPEWAALSLTGYGMDFLQVVIPQLTGQIFFVPGRTLA